MLSPSIQEKIRNESFRPFLRKRFCFEFYGVDWKFDPILLGRSEHFTFIRNGGGLIAQHARSGMAGNWFSRGGIETEILETGVAKFVRIVNAATREILYVTEMGTPGSMIRLNSTYLLRSNRVTIDHFDIRMEAMV
jgi:hypothetical protein